MVDLSPPQKAVVHYINGPLLILAGAGSGKTTLLTYKVAWLIREYGIEPSEIACISRTAGAARLMRARLAEFGLGARSQTTRLTTFAELGLAIIRERLDALTLRPGFSLYDATDSEAVISRLLQERLPHASALAPQIQRQISLWKRQRIEPSAVVEPESRSAADIAAWLYRRYQERLIAANAVDLDDLLLKPVRLLASEPAFAKEWCQRVRFLLVDEYEQTSGCEHELTRLLATGGTLLTAAGDADQAIADDSNASLERLKSDIPDLRTVKLSQNFRSTGRVLKAAQTLLAPLQPQAEKSSWSEREYGVPLRVIRARGEEHEAERVVASILDHKTLHGLDYRNYAILFRRPEHIAGIERALRTRRVPYHLRGGASLFDQTEIRDLLGYLKLLVNPSDDNAFLRVINTPRRPIDHAALYELARYASYSQQSLFNTVLDPALDSGYDPGSLAVLRDFVRLLTGLCEAAHSASPGALVVDLLAKLRYEAWLRDTCNDVKLAERRMENVMQLIALLERRARHQPEMHLPALAMQLNYTAALDPEGDDLPSDGVVLSTITAAKGREFAHVFIIGAEEGTLPFTGSDSDADTHRERRLMCVALTRARDSVTFTIAERRRQAAEAMRQPSRYLIELAADLEGLNGSAPTHPPIDDGGFGGFPPRLRP